MPYVKNTAGRWEMSARGKMGNVCAGSVPVDVGSEGELPPPSALPAPPAKDKGSRAAGARRHEGAAGTVVLPSGASFSPPENLRGPAASTPYTRRPAPSPAPTFVSGTLSAAAINNELRKAAQGLQRSEESDGAVRGIAQLFLTDANANNRAVAAVRHALRAASGLAALLCASHRTPWPLELHCTSSS